MPNANSEEQSESLTRRVASFAASTRYSEIPPEVRQCARRAVLDCLGLALAGSKAEGSAIVRRHIGSLRCSDRSASVFGTDLLTAPRFAALANGTAMHADDYDDTFHPSRVHPSAPVVAALFAEAERRNCTGEALLAAVAVGAEVTCKISAATGGRHYQRGYHATGTCGVFGAAAAVCNMLGLPVERAVAALGIAGSESAGLRENFGTMVKPLHSGRAAENGLVAADLAAMGLTASPTILEGARGFYAAGSGDYDAAAIQGKLGNPWTFTDPGISIKPFPSGALTHPAMGKMLDLVLEHDVRPEQVEGIRVTTNRLLPENLTYHRPRTGLEGKFSMEFCLAAILVLRKGGLSEFTDEVVNRPDIQHTIAKIDYDTYDDATAVAENYTRLTTFLDIVLKGGCRITGRADQAKGSPDMPMSDAEVAEKFRACAAFAAWPAARTEAIIEVVSGLETLARVSELTALLRIQP
jgi:2-methylcitrate dehydratase PrpD